MNILLVGNGFDLAHGLPTKYRDFLNFVHVMNQVLQVKKVDDLNSIDYSGINSEIEYLIKFWMKRESENFFKQMQEWESLLDHNFWIEYFLKVPMHQKENWIDFEYEISKVIQSLDADMKKHNCNLDDIAEKISNKNIIKFFELKKTSNIAEEVLSTGEIVSYRVIRDVLYKDLDRLIRAFEMYLSDYIEIMKIEIQSLEIRNLNIDHVLSFNYTNTYSRCYNNVIRRVEYDYLHGKVNCGAGSIATNNMVLGIDEYLPEDRKNSDIDFIAFKKYYQRIYKATGCKYKHWVDIIRESEYSCKQKLKKQFPEQVPYNKFTTKHQLYIFGHSLDITDRDVLRDLILNDSVLTTIFYCKKYNENGKDDNGKQDLGAKIANLVKIIGQDELIRRTGGDTETIKFKLQEDMVASGNLK